MKTSYIKKLIEDINNLQGGSLLELGCGTKRRLAVCRHVYAGIDIHDLWDGLQRDIVASYNVLEHVKHIKAFLELSVSACKDGGYIIHKIDNGHNTAKDVLLKHLCFLKLMPETRWLKNVDMAGVIEYYLDKSCELIYSEAYNNSVVLWFKKKAAGANGLC